MNESLQYSERLPRRTDAPPFLLILLHGYGANEHDLLGLADALDPRFHCVSPRAPLDLPWGGHAWYGIDFLEDGVECRFEQAPAALAPLETLLDSLRARLAPAQTFLLGFSQGGGMALNLGLRRPGDIDGVVSLSGLYAPPLHPDPQPTVPPTYPVFMSHGRQDPVLPVESGRQARQLVESLSVDLTYREYDMAHEINPHCLEDLRAWLDARLPA